MRTGRIAALALAISGLLLASGCVGINIGSYSGDRFVEGAGEVVTRTVEVADYDAVRIEGDFDVVYRSEPSGKVAFTMHENLYEHMKISVEDGKLYIDCEKRFKGTEKNTPTVYLSSPALREVDIRGFVAFTEADAIAGDSFAINVSGGCDANFTLTVRELTADLSGFGALTLSGTATQASIDLSGIGDINALELDVETAFVEMSGTGSAKISCSKALEAEVSGIGSLEYRGNPATVKQDVSGVGTVTKIG